MLLNYINLNACRRRMHCRAAGWDPVQARIFRARMIAVVDTMTHAGGGFTALTDLTDLAVHAQPVAPIVAEGANQLQRLVLDRYAMIVPMALMRIQVRRLHTGVNLRFCENREEAMAWLGWQENDATVLQPPVAA